MTSLRRYVCPALLVAGILVGFLSPSTSGLHQRTVVYPPNVQLAENPPQIPPPPPLPRA